MTRDELITNEIEARGYCAQWTDAEGMERLDRFASLLLSENRRQNLISKPSESQLWQRHFADSTQLLEYVPRETRCSIEKPWLDLGTGAGFPGLVLAILKPESRFLLVESRARRVEFLELCIEDLGLTGCRVRGERMERIDPFPASVISARAFAPLEKLLRLSAPFSTKSTRYLLPKGRSAAHALEEQKRSIRTMFHVKQSLTDPEAGIIVSK